MTTATPASPAKPPTRPKQLTLAQAEQASAAANAALLEASERELRAQQKARQDAEAAERAAQVAARTAADKAAEAAARAATMQRRLNGTPAPAVAAPVVPTTPAAPVAADVPEPEPAPTAPVADDRAPAGYVPDPFPAPTSPTPEVDGAPRHARFRILDTWRDAPIWMRVVIVLAAVVGAFIFLLVGKATTGIIRWGTSEWWPWLSTVTVIIWHLGLIVGGFGLGGWLSARWFARRR